MGFTLKIEGNESLFFGENIVQMVTASLLYNMKNLNKIIF